jgi:signal transduction histidine kinase
MQGDTVGTGIIPSYTPKATKRVATPLAFRWMENAPVAMIVVGGPNHTILFANRMFRVTTGSGELESVGRTVIEVLDSRSGGGFRSPPGTGLIALLDGARQGNAAWFDPEIPPDTVSQGVLKCRVWPASDVASDNLEFIVELRPSREDDTSLARQRQIAERMLLSALREQSLSQDNIRLYGVANDARAVAVEAKTHAEDAQRDAESANSAKAQFLANMSHELRTPLNAIGGYAQLMEMGLRGPVTKAQLVDLGRIRSSQAHLLGLINSVLSYAKLEAGRVVYVIQSLLLDELVRESESLVDPQLNAKGLHYHYEPCAGALEGGNGSVVRVSADSEKLRQIILNLLTNAIKFTLPGGHISLTCRVLSGTVALSISDTGRGIPASKLQTIFDPFVQIGRGLTSNDDGVGLGLAISRDLAVGMAGDLTVRSVEGEGSTFVLTLPRAA